MYSITGWVSLQHTHTHTPGVHLQFRISLHTSPGASFTQSICAPVFCQWSITWRTNVEVSTCGTMLEFKMIVDLSGLWAFWLGMLNLYGFNLNAETQCDLASETSLLHTVDARRDGRCFSGSHVILVMCLLGFGHLSLKNSPNHQMIYVVYYFHL